MYADLPLNNYYGSGVVINPLLQKEMSEKKNRN
jgi:hypothetical protein